MRTKKNCQNTFVVFYDREREMRIAARNEALQTATEQLQLKIQQKVMNNFIYCFGISCFSVNHSCQPQVSFLYFDLRFFQQAETTRRHEQVLEQVKEKVQISLLGFQINQETALFVSRWISHRPWGLPQCIRVLF